VGATSSATRQVTAVDEPPTAAFGMTPAVPIPGQAIAFGAGGSSDPDGAISAYAWDFGDGTTGTGSSASHAFGAAGTYEVRLTVVDRDGQRASTSRTLTVYVQPQATFSTSPVLPVEQTPTSFTAISTGSDPASMISSYAWSFGDGASAGGANVTHTYAHEGTYRVTLTVTDALGLTSSTSEVVTVIDGPPVAAVSILSGQRLPGHPIVFSGARSHDFDDPVVGYLWHFGDGSGGVGRRITHVFRRVGSYRVSLTVRDSFGQTATVITLVRVGQARDVAKARRSRGHRRHRKG
jgi:PKD repeat protein